jgi:hypothetical protein
LIRTGASRFLHILQEVRPDCKTRNQFSKCFGFVQTLDEKPKRRLFEVLHSQGLSLRWLDT